MGQGGQIVLVNGTIRTWDLVESQRYQMEWEFERDAKTVGLGEVKSVYVEAESGWFKNKEKDAGKAVFRLRDTNLTFEIDASYLTLRAVFNNFSTQNNPQGAQVSLGTLSDRPSYFVLSGRDENLHSINTAPNWMQANIGHYGSRTLRQLCLPLSHDAGMSRVSYKTGWAGEGAIITQLRTVEQQLHLGVRIFDIRPVFFQDRFVCGHYSYIETTPINSWQGGNGEYISDIVQGINRFTADNKELIVLQLSHAYNTHSDAWGRAGSHFTDLTKDEWHRLLGELTGPNGIHSESLFICKGDPTTVDLTTIPLNEFIGQGRSRGAVLLMVHADIDLGEYANKGCYRDQRLPMDGGGVDDMRNKRKNDGDQAFVYWATRMQTDWEAVKSTFWISSASVITLAKEPKDKMFKEVLPACSRYCYPTALALDAIDSTDVTALALAINDIACGLV